MKCSVCEKEIRNYKTFKAIPACSKLCALELGERRSSEQIIKIREEILIEASHKYYNYMWMWNEERNRINAVADKKGDSL
jgi:endogenous inhibitor of DNA gyrase (YacG/DUF329 family)